MTLEQLREVKKKRRLTKEEKASYREFWKDSGLSKKRFCEQEGLVLPTFLSWFSGLATHSNKDKQEAGFLPIQMVSTSSFPEDSGKQLVLSLPNGLTISGTFTRTELSLWLKELRDAVTSLR